MTETVSKVHYAYLVPVKFRGSAHLYDFGTNLDQYHVGDQVVVDTKRGNEMATVSKEAVAMEGEREDIRPILRKADEQDKADYEENFQLEKEAFEMANQYIEELKLPMSLLSAELTLDRTNCLFIYGADGYVDFRELVSKLRNEMYCRIEMKGIGQRDRAKMIGGIGICGRETCCSRFMNSFETVSINMAKNQMLALNQSKLSGMCGKFMCCLRFENEAYKEAREGLPKIGSHIEYQGMIYKLGNMNLIQSTARLETRDTVETITLEELTKNGKVVKKDPSLPVGLRVGPAPKPAPVSLKASAAELKASPYEKASSPRPERKQPENKAQRSSKPKEESRGKGNNRNNRNRPKSHEGLVPQKNQGTKPATNNRFGPQAKKAGNPTTSGQHTSEKRVFGKKSSETKPKED